MNVYDFDKTIYDGDCTVNFWIFCMRRYPTTLRALPSSISHALKFKLGQCSREEFKEQFYGFLRFVPNVEQEVERFWDLHLKKIKPFYLEQRRTDDVVISASPEFLVNPVCKRLGVACIASKVDVETGRLMGANCRGEEKVNRFFSEYPGGTIERFYSDSHSDCFIAKKANEAYIVRGTRIEEWDA